MISFASFSLPTAIALYWVVTNGFIIVQNKVIKTIISKEDKKDTIIKPTKSKKDKKDSTDAKVVKSTKVSKKSSKKRG